MCGSAGIFAGASAGWSTESATKVLRQMTDAQVHRGPDAEGVWLDERNRCHLGHRRLSIIDVSDAGRQPMVSTDGRRVIVFNGEIYNYLELRPQLAALGRDIRGRTDTEVLLEAIAAWGIDAFPKLDGMMRSRFSIATAATSFWRATPSERNRSTTPNCRAVAGED